MQAHRQVTPPLFGRVRLMLTALALATVVYCVAVLVLRALPLPNIVALVLVVGAPYVPVLALCGVVISVLSRRRALAFVAATVLVAAVAVQVPWYYRGRSVAVGQHADVRVLSANLRKGQADASSFIELAKGSADVITVSELTAEEVRRLSQAGIEAEFPYSVLTPAPGAAGIGLWSRFPLAALPSGEYRNANAVARLQIPGVKVDPVLASVHIISPVATDSNAFSDWRMGIAAIKADLDDFAHIAGPGAVIVAGDFNSTPDMRQFRDLLTNGYRDAVEQTGAGFEPTFPSYPWFPPLITIDHVLTRQAAVSSLRSVYVPGTDHRALLATVDVPFDRQSS